jgi:TonB family protein
LEITVLTKTLLISLLIFSGVAYGQISRGSLIRIGDNGDTLYTPLAIMEIVLDKYSSILLTAEDTIKPYTVAIIFAASDTIDDIEAMIVNPYGSDIKLSKGRNSIFYNVVKIPKVVGIAELTWDKFVELCKVKMITIETKRRKIDLSDKEMQKLSSFYFYLSERVDNEQPPADVVECEVEPKVLKSVAPKYPEEALRAAYEGNAFVKVWVDSNGKVRKVVPLKADALIFLDSAIEAARNYLFSPALYHGRPVSVWVSIPFRFRLKGSR